MLIKSIRLLFAIIFVLVFFFFYWLQFLCSETNGTLSYNCKLNSWIYDTSLYLQASNQSEVVQPRKLMENSAHDIWFSTFLLIMIPIRASDNDSRQLIRDTCFKGCKSRNDVALRFAISERYLQTEQRLKYIKENASFGDIIFVNTIDSSDTLTNKTLAIFTWAYHHVKYSYFMKCDDDTYVFITEVLNDLKNRQSVEKLYYGIMAPQSKPIRGHKKWADNDWDLGPFYLPFALGGCYIISYDLIKVLSELSPYLKWHINEDTAVGAWLSAFEIERKTGDGRFCFWFKNVSIKGCKCIQTQCKEAILVILFYNHTRRDLRRHFTSFHEQVSSNLSIKATLTTEKIL